MIKKSFKLENNYLLDNKYKVLFSIKKGQYAETYRVKTNDNQEENSIQKEEEN